MTENQAKNALYGLGEKLLDYDKDFCLVLQSGSGYECYIKCNDGSLAYYANISNFRAEDFTFNDGTKAISFVGKPTSKPAKPKSSEDFRNIIATPKIVSGIATLGTPVMLILDEGTRKLEIYFCNGTDKYLREKVRDGDYLKLRVTDFCPPDYSLPQAEWRTFSISEVYDILEHRRTTVLR